MLKAIFFDLDGTLVDTLPLYIKAYDRALKNQGFYFSNKKIVEICFGKTEKTICSNLGIISKTKEFTDDYFSGVKNFYNKTKLFDNVTETLDFAKEKKLELVIISFAYRWYVDKMLEKLNLNKYFKLVIGFDDVKQAKPDPEAIIKACGELEINSNEVLMIGDSKSDVIMGNAANTRRDGQNNQFRTKNR